MSLLALALAVGRVLERNEINWMSEAGGALIVGIVIGLIVTLLKLDSNYSSFFEFNVRSHVYAVCIRPAGHARVACNYAGQNCAGAMLDGLCTAAIV